MKTVEFTQMKDGTKEDYELIERAAKWGLKVWIDLDDNYWEIPPLNRAHNFFDKDRLKILDNCLRLADLITVSTDPLNEYISKFRFIRCPIHTVKNAINDFVLGEFFVHFIVTKFKTYVV